MTTQFIRATVTALFPEVNKVFLKVHEVKDPWSAFGTIPKDGVVLLELDYKDAIPCRRGDEVVWCVDLLTFKNSKVNSNGKGFTYCYHFSGKVFKNLTEVEQPSTDSFLGLLKKVFTTLHTKRRAADVFF